MMRRLRGDASHMLGRVCVVTLEATCPPVIEGTGGCSGNEDILWRPQGEGPILEFGVKISR